MKKSVIFLGLLYFLAIAFTAPVEAGMLKSILKGAGSAAVGGAAGYYGAKKAEPYLEKTVPHVKKGLKAIGIGLLKKAADTVAPGSGQVIDNGIQMKNAIEAQGYHTNREKARREPEDKMREFRRAAGAPY